MIHKIAVINKSKTPLGVDFQKLVAAMQYFANTCVAPSWGAACDLFVQKKPVRGAWHMIFVDDADVADALGYHEYLHGMPLAKIFVRTTIDDGQLVSVTATHELAEMLVDPDATQTVRRRRNGMRYALEVADAVEETSFKVNGIDVTNFVLPTWFEEFKHPAGTKFDYLGKCRRPFQLLKGGYAAVEDGDGNWTQIFGSQAKADRFQKEDRRGHRIESLRMC